MTWTKYPDNTPPERIKLFGLTEDGDLKVVRYYKGKFDTYCKIIYYCVPDKVKGVKF